MQIIDAKQARNAVIMSVLFRENYRKLAQYTQEQINEAIAQGEFEVKINFINSGLELVISKKVFREIGTVITDELEKKGYSFYWYDNEEGLLVTW